MIRDLQLGVALVIGALCATAGPADAGSRHRPALVQQLGAGSDHGFRTHPVHRPGVVPGGQPFAPFYNQRPRTIVINTVVIIQAPRPGVRTVADLPVVMGIRNLPPAEPAIHRVSGYSAGGKAGTR